MSKELKTDIIDGKIIDWSKLSREELNAIKSKTEEEKKDILKQIDELLKIDEEG